MKNILLFLIILISFFTVSCEDAPSKQVSSCITIDDCSKGYTCIDTICKKETEEEIRDCNDDGDCSNGYECNSDYTCVEKKCNSKSDCSKGFICKEQECITGCENNSDCDTDRVCDSETKKCREDNQETSCILDSDICEDGFECDQMTGKCKEASKTCTKDSDCSSLFKCEVNKCIPRVFCTSNEACLSSEVCRDNYCRVDNGCDTDAYCIEKNPNKPACSVNSGLCYQCTDDEHCVGLDNQICDTLTHTCGDYNSNEECQVDSDCGLNKRCNLSTDPHECVDMISRCTSDNDCQNSMFCKSDSGRCVMCLENNHCSSPKVCNINTNICETETGTGDGNALCDTFSGSVTCLLMGGTCSGVSSGDCIMPSDPCEEITCPAHSNCSEGVCNCETGYHLSGDLCVENLTCDGFDCPLNASCKIIESERGCYCNDGFTATDTDNDGTKDTCVEDGEENPGSICASNSQCFGLDSYCATSYTQNGYCTSTCVNDGDTCMQTGVCDSGNCFKSCTLGNDSSCGRSDLICTDGGTGIGGTCTLKCDANNQCATGYCNTGTGRCELNYMNCNQNNPLNSGCPEGQFCTTYENRDLCFPNGDAISGASCDWTGDCQAGLVCIGSSTSAWCRKYCEYDYECPVSTNCISLSGELYGYCN